MSSPEATQRLLHRSEDELWLACLFRFHTQGARALPPLRFAGMFEHFRTHPAFVAVCALPSASEFGRGCAAFLDNQPLATLSPEVHHALALYFETVAEALYERPQPMAPEVARFTARALSHWLRLFVEGAYLRAWIVRVAGGEADATAILAAFAERRISKLEDAVRAASAAANPTAALGVLRTLSVHGRAEVWKLAGLPLETGPDIQQSMKRAFERLVQEMMDAFTRELDAAEAKGEDASLRADRVATLGLRLSLATQEFDEAERLVLSRAEQVGWDLRRGRDWKRLSKLYGTLSLLVLRFADSVEGDPDKFAFSARAAQALTFLADARDGIDERIALTERALQICPGHPMAKTMLSFYLATRGLKIVRAASTTAERAAARREAGDLYQRAKELDPKDEAVKQLGTLLEAVG